MRQVQCRSASARPRVLFSFTTGTHTTTSGKGATNLQRAPPGAHRLLKALLRVRGKLPGSR
jgi:hypothetical protein